MRHFRFLQDPPPRNTTTVLRAVFLLLLNLLLNGPRLQLDLVVVVELDEPPEGLALGGLLFLLVHVPEDVRALVPSDERFNLLVSGRRRRRKLRAVPLEGGVTNRYLLHVGLETVQLNNTHILVISKRLKKSFHKFEVEIRLDLIITH